MPKIKILTVFAYPWEDDNNIGNSFSNILGNNENYELAHVYCSPGSPKTSVCRKFYQMTELSIIRNLFNSKTPSGMEVFVEENCSRSPQKQSLLMNKAMIFFRTHRLTFFFWLRNFIWSFGNWKSKELNEFVESFKPDIIFYNIDYFIYTNNIALYIKKLSQAKMVGYFWDDIYSYKQFSLSPFFWIDRCINRFYIRKVVSQSSMIYVISEYQKREYDRSLGINSRLLCKGADFKCFSQSQKTLKTPLKIVYSGNIISGRWKTLAVVSNCIKEINNDGVKMQLYITTANNVSDKIRKRLINDNSSFLLGKLPLTEVEKIQKQADILLYVEPFTLTERYIWRLSFSTKIVDYLEKARCILAIGWEGGSGMKYLKDNDAALTVTDPKSIKKALNSLIDNPEIISDYSRKAYSCGIRNHQLQTIHTKLYTDFCSLVIKQ